MPSRDKHGVDGSAGVLDQALLGVVQLAIAPLAVQLGAVEAELARLRTALQETSSAKTVSGVRFSSRGLALEKHASESRGEEASQAAVVSECSSSARDSSRLRRGCGDTDSSAEFARGTLVVEVDAERAEWLPVASPTSSRGTNSAHAMQTPLSGGPSRHRTFSNSGRTPPCTSSSSMTEDILNVTTRFRDDGNTLCRMRDYDAAAQHYAKAIEELSERTSDSAWPHRAWPRSAIAHSLAGNSQSRPGSAGRAVLAIGQEEVVNASPHRSSGGFKRLSSCSGRGKAGAS